MKRKNNLYNQINNISVIKNMYDKRIRSNTKNKIKLLKFENNYVSNITLIKQIINSKKYIQGHYNLFIIKEPKVRLIMSQNIIDKVINHLVSEYFLVQIFDKSLIEYNVATRSNKGTHYAMKYLNEYLNKNIHKNLYILKFDISKYFYNIDHNILKQLIRKKIKDKDVLNILDNIIDSTDLPYINQTIKKLKQNIISKIKNIKTIKDINNIPYYKKGKGLPIGNMTSQALAIIYLNELDHYIKEKLKIKCYIRYMDDGILVSDNKEYLKHCLKEIETIVHKYKLELNENKTIISSLTHGFEFLGFRYIKSNNHLIVKVKNQTKRKFKYKMKKLNKLYLDNKIKYDYFNQVKTSYEGHLSYGNTKNLLQNTFNKYQETFDKGKKEKQKEKIRKYYRYKKYKKRIKRIVKKQKIVYNLIIRDRTKKDV